MHFDLNSVVNVILEPIKMKLELILFDYSSLLLSQTLSVHK